MQTINRSVVVIGAGPAGIGAGLTLKGECTVLERTASIGGLAEPVNDNGTLYGIN